MIFTHVTEGETKHSIIQSGVFHADHINEGYILCIIIVSITIHVLVVLL